MQAIILLVLAAALYFGLKTDAPTPPQPWRPYAYNRGIGKLEWFFSTYSSEDECIFYAEKTIKAQNLWYGKPSGCLYGGYQNPYILWIVNSVKGDRKFRCIARLKNRDKFEDPIYSPVLRDYPSDHGDNWDCIW